MRKILNKNLQIHIKVRGKHHPINIGLVVIVILFSIITWFLTEHIVYQLNEIDLAASEWVNDVRPVTKAAGVGPLRPLPSNPRYFTDGTGKAIYLAGDHTWWHIRQGSTLGGFKNFLDWLQSHGNNYTRLWTGISYLDFDPNSYPGPYPWTRPGGGMAVDGQPKFDMHSLNQSYFDFLRAMVQEVQNRGMYCSVMFFGSFNGLRKPAGWQASAWNPNNNINPELAKAFDPNDGYSFYTADSDALAIQEKLVKKYIDTLNDLDNFIFEVFNEPDYTFASQVWHNTIINYVKTYEATKPKQHMVGPTGGWDKPLSNGYLMNSPGDWWSPQAGVYNGYDYRQGGPAAYSAKPVIVDSDHFDGGLYKSTTQDVNKGIRLVWKTFTRGNNPLLMDCYKFRDDPAFGCFGDINPVFDPIRDALGHTLNYADRFSDLSLMVPSESDCSTTYCLRNPGIDYVVYQPNSGAFTVNLTAGDYTYEWFNPHSGSVTASGQITAGNGNRSFTPPFSGDAVLYLKRAASNYTDTDADGYNNCAPGDSGDDGKAVR